MNDGNGDRSAPKPAQRPAPLRDMSPRVGIGCYAVMIVILAALVTLVLVFREHLWG